VLLGSRWYWVVAAALIVLGSLAILSVGAPLALLGLGLLLAGPWRDRPGVVPATVAGVVGLTLGYVLLTPLTCTGEAAASTARNLVEGTTRCWNVLGIPYRGGPGYDPPLLPAVVGGLVLGSIVAALTFRWRSGRTPARSGGHANAPQGSSAR
jgi:hypothetical protein